MAKRLTIRMLKAVSSAGALAEAGSPTDFFGGIEGDPEGRREWEAMIDAGYWARGEIQRRKSRAKKRARGG